jgi:3-oxo-5-alpha-steroid 4-dehydrogenase 1
VCWFGTHLHGEGWAVDAAMIAGCVLFFTGFAIHVYADMQLQQLRKMHGPEYHAPQGGMYRLISCPNYFGEVIEWIGWAMLTWSPAGLVFALWTAANLIPRAVASHKWYRNCFADYPRDRKAILPFIL